MFRLLQTGENKMNTKNNRKTQNTLILILILTTLSVLVSGCSSSNTPPNNPSPSPTPTVEKKLAENSPSPTPTPKNPAEAFYGEWETKDQNGNFQTVKFGPATQKGDDYVGTYIDVNTKQDLSEYKIKPNNNLAFLDLPGTATAGRSATFDYEFSDEGNTITLKGNPSRVYKRGTNNADILNDIKTISTGSDWKPDAQTLKYFGISNNNLLRFLGASKFDEGYTGVIVTSDNNFQTSHKELGKYTITSKGNVIISHDGGKKSAKYTLLGDNVLRIEFLGGDPPMNLTR